MNPSEDVKKILNIAIPERRSFTNQRIRADLEQLFTEALQAKQDRIEEADRVLKIKTQRESELAAENKRLMNFPIPVWVCPGCRIASCDKGYELFIKNDKLRFQIADLQAKLSKAREAIKDYTDVRAMIHQTNPKTGKDFCDKHCFCRLKQTLSEIGDK